MVQEDRLVMRVGALLRRSRIDQLPQLLNVLRGEMSQTHRRTRWAGRLALACSTLLLALVTLVPSATPAQSAAGLVAGFAFNEGSGTSAADASGSGLTGTLTNGAAWGTGRNAGAVSLDGVNDFVELGEPGAAAVDGEHDRECVGQLGGVPG